MITLFFLAVTTGALSAVSLRLNGDYKVQMIAAQGFGPKLQYGGGGSFELGFPVLPWLEIDASLGFVGLFPSDVSGGFTYRGIVGGDLGLGVEALGRIGSWKDFGELRLGGGLGVAGAIVAYEYTTLWFFYPEARARLVLEYIPAFCPSMDFRLLLPLSMQLRRDVDYSVQAGLGLAVSYRLGGKK